MIYALQLYFSGLSLRKTSQQLSQFIKRNHVSIWKWIQRYKPSKIFKGEAVTSDISPNQTRIKVDASDDITGDLKKITLKKSILVIPFSQ